MVHHTLPILAAVYRDGAQFETLLQMSVAELRASGLKLAGLVQHSVPNPNRRKCDMVLEDVATGERHPISQDRGALARGCVLDTDRLLTAALAAEKTLVVTTDLLVLCKFGKAEVEGGGVRSLLAQALDLDVPVLIGVPEMNRVSFETFAESLFVPIEVADADVATLAEQALGFVRARRLPEVKDMPAAIV